MNRSMPRGAADRLARWTLLEGVPLAYLVPDPGLLPPESIRFFHLDPAWIRSLLEGAFSIVLQVPDEGAEKVGLNRFGRVQQSSINARRIKLKKPELDAEDIELVPMTGLLLRSQIVSRYPAFRIRTFSKGKPMTLLRFDRLEKDIAFALFAGVPDRIELVEPDQGLLQGVEPGWTLRPEAVEVAVGSKRTVEVQNRNKERDGVIDVARLQRDLEELAQGDAKNDVGSARLSIALTQTAFTQIYDVDQQDSSRSNP